MVEGCADQIGALFPESCDSVHITRFILETEHHEPSHALGFFASRVRRSALPYHTTEVAPFTERAYQLIDSTHSVLTLEATMDSVYLAESRRLEQQLADAYRAYRHYFETVSYPSTEDEWAELDQLRDAITRASAEWGDYCLNNKHLR